MNWSLILFIVLTTIILLSGLFYGFKTLKRLRENPRNNNSMNNEFDLLRTPDMYSVYAIIALGWFLILSLGFLLL